MYNQWSVLLLFLLTILTPWTASHSSKRDLPMSRGGRTCSKAMPSDAHGHSHITSTKKSLLPPRCLWFTNQIGSSAVRGKRRPSALPLEKVQHMTLLPFIATHLSTFLSADRAGRSSRAAQGLAAQSPLTLFWAGKQMPHSECTSGTSGVQKLQSRQTYCHSLATCCLTHQLWTLWL